jgi:hypothetical protein
LEPELPNDIRAYLYEYFSDEDGWQEEVPENLASWFDGLGRYVIRLPAKDPRLELATQALEPFFNDPRYEGYVMYPEGFAIEYVEHFWGGDFDAFLTGFVQALQRDAEGQDL